MRRFAMIERKQYLDQLISKKENGMIKVITGIRRCGKSYLLFEIYHQYLNSIGVDDEHIIELALDDDENIRYRNPIELGEYIRSLLVDKDKMYYIFLDEIQKVKTIKNPYSDDTVGFVDVLLGLMKKKNADVYVTGSNSRMLSSDILTEFRGRGDEVRVYPLTFAEFYASFEGDKHDAWQEYYTYGGMPYVSRLKDHRSKAQYLTDLFENIYLKDILERHNIQDKNVLDDLLDVISSAVGSLTNPTKVAATINTVQKRSGESVVALNTVKAYMDHLSDSFLFTECKRWDVKGKHYFDYPNKYYCEDIGLRNARIGFRQQEMTHIMENIIFNELLIRECSIDIGIVYSNEKNAKGKATPVAREIDFIATSGGKKTYIQSAYALGTEEKAITENRPFALTGDSFPKIIVRHDIRKRWYDDNGILNISVIDFLLDDTLV